MVISFFHGTSSLVQKIRKKEGSGFSLPWKSKLEVKNNVSLTDFHLIPSSIQLVDGSLDLMDHSNEFYRFYAEELLSYFKENLCRPAAKFTPKRTYLWFEALFRSKTDKNFAFGLTVLYRLINQFHFV